MGTMVDSLDTGKHATTRMTHSGWAGTSPPTVVSSGDFKFIVT